MMKRLIFLLLVGCAVSFQALAQTSADDPTFAPTVKVGKVLDRGDSIQYMELSNVYVYPQMEFKNQRQQASYMRLVKNVKAVLPVAAFAFSSASSGVSATTNSSSSLPFNSSLLAFSSSPAFPRT